MERCLVGNPMTSLRYAAASSGVKCSQLRDLDEFAAASQPRQRQRRVGAASDDQVYLPW
jgi:hypothetical protein